MNDKQVPLTDATKIHWLELEVQRLRSDCAALLSRTAPTAQPTAQATEALYRKVRKPYCYEYQHELGGPRTYWHIALNEGKTPPAGWIAIEYIDSYEPVASAAPAQASAEPPLSGRWHHGAGVLVCGSVRISREDFDMDPSEQFKTKMLDWMCATLNAAVDASRYDELCAPVAQASAEPVTAEQLSELLRGLECGPAIALMPAGWLFLMGQEIAEQAKKASAAPVSINSAVEVDFVKKSAIDSIIREVAELPDRNSPEGWPEAMIVTSDELRDILEDRLVPVAQASAEPVAVHQFRHRPTWGNVEHYWQPWKDCSASAYEDYLRTPRLNDWEVEVRKLYAALAASAAPVVPRLIVEQEIRTGNPAYAHLKASTVPVVPADDRLKNLHNYPDTQNAANEITLGLLRHAISAIDKHLSSATQSAPSVSAAPVVPDGWQIVPKEPTQEMLDNTAAFGLGHNNDADNAVIYRAMIAAAPAQENK
jgi:hypothetical protein